jgi:ligand-binding sensor domain-containing protein
MLTANPSLGKISSVNIVNDPSRGVEVWMGSGKKLYSWLDQERSATVETAGGNLTEWDSNRGLDEDYWEGILLDRSGTLWAGGLRRVAALTRGAARFVDRSIPGSTQGSAYAHAPLVEDREGRVLAPADDGIARWDGRHWQIVGHGNGLQIMTHVEGMTFDTTGDLWMGTLGDGLYQWAGYRDWEGWSQPQGLPSSAVWTVLPSKDQRIYVGTDKGPAWIDPRDGPKDRWMRWASIGMARCGPEPLERLYFMSIRRQERQGRPPSCPHSSPAPWPAQPAASSSPRTTAFTPAKAKNAGMRRKGLKPRIPG